MAPRRGEKKKKRSTKHELQNGPNERNLYRQKNKPSHSEVELDRRDV